MTKEMDFYKDLPGQVRAFFDRQYYDSYTLFKASRHPRTGLYADAYMTLGKIQIIDAPSKLQGLAS